MWSLSVCLPKRSGNVWGQNTGTQLGIVYKEPKLDIHHVGFPTLPFRTGLGVSSERPKSLARGPHRPHRPHLAGEILQGQFGISTWDEDLGV